jgi:hypothetical protein
LGKFLDRFDRKLPTVRHLAARLNSPTKFIPPHGGPTAHGYEATLLVDICEAVLEANAASPLRTG